MAMQAPAAVGPAWLQGLLSVLVVLGGLGGIGAVGTVLVQRRKFRAEAADVLTDTALTLVQPLRDRVAELETEVVETRRKAVAAGGEVDRLRDSLRDMARIMLRWREAILADPSSSTELRELVRSAPSPEANGHRPQRRRAPGRP